MVSFSDGFLGGAKCWLRSVSFREGTGGFFDLILYYQISSRNRSRDTKRRDFGEQPNKRFLVKLLVSGKVLEGCPGTEVRIKGDRISGLFHPNIPHL